MKAFVLIKKHIEEFEPTRTSVVSIFSTFKKCESFLIRKKYKRISKYEWFKKINGYESECIIIKEMEVK